MEETPNMIFYQGQFWVKRSWQRMIEIMVVSYRICIQVPAIFYLIMMHASIMFLCYVVSVMWPVSMKANFGTGEMSIYWFVVVFLGMFLSLSGSSFSSRLNQFYLKRWAHSIPNPTLWSWLASGCLTSAVPIVVLGLSNKWGFVSLPLFIGCVGACFLGYGFIRPKCDILINNYIPKEHSHERATIISLANMLASFIEIFLFFPAIGEEAATTAVGWLVPSGMLLGLTIALHFFIRRYQKKTGELCAPTFSAPLPAKAEVEAL
jgi:hypothetical protein